MAHTQLSTSTKVSVGIAAVALVGLGAYGFAFLLQDESTFRSDSPRLSPRQVVLDRCLNKCVEGADACLANPRIKREVCDVQQNNCEQVCRAEFTASGSQSGDTGVPPVSMGARVYDIQTAALPPAWVNKSYNVLLEVKNVPEGARVQWSLETGRLPEGVKLGVQDGLLSGVPTEAGSYPVRIRVESSEGSGTKDLALLVNPDTGVSVPPPAPPASPIVPSIPSVITLPEGVFLPAASVVISTESALPEARIGKSYRVQLDVASAPFNKLPITWRVESGRFPEGVKLSEASGLISGIPTEPGRYLLRIRANNGTAYGIKEMVLLVMSDETIAPPDVPPPSPPPAPPTPPTPPAPPVQGIRSIIIENVSLPETVLNRSYRVQMNHGMLPFPNSAVTWSVVAGRLPEGVKLGDRDGVLAGIPTEAGNFHITIRVENTVNARGEREFDLLVRPGSVPVPPTPPVVPPTPPAPPIGPVSREVSPELLPVGTVGQLYSQRLQAVGANHPFTWRLVAGTLPRGLDFDEEQGLFRGTPTEAGQILLSLRGSDNRTAGAETEYASRQYVLTIEPGRPALVVAASSAFPEGRVGQAYKHQPLIASGGAQPYAWRIESGRLPEGVTLNPATGVVLGTPTEAGVFTLHIRVSDAAQGQVSDDFNFRVLPPVPPPSVGTNPPVTMLTPFVLASIQAMPNGTVGDHYNFRPMQVSGGRTPYQWSVPPEGRLPSGLSVDGNGLITGVPTAAGTYTFTLQAQDADGQRLYTLFTLTINPRAQYQQIYNHDPQWPIRVNRINDMGLRVHDLIKLVDDGDPNTQYDTTVYYVGADGRRHAFPNAKVYFTWFSDYAGVRVVLPRQLADIPLGPNMTYRPGVRMVKFLTDPRVYAVDTQRRLRWVVHEQIARELYGDYWNQNIDDVSDAFYMDYRFDAPSITSRYQFDPDVVRRSVGYPSEVLP